ncbi:hypothetical protein HPNQ4161_1123, partial [Helicobacter pylori NQ4161]
MFWLDRGFDWFLLGFRGFAFSFYFYSNTTLNAYFFNKELA